jgi:transposase
MTASMRSRRRDFAHTLDASGPMSWAFHCGFHWSHLRRDFQAMIDRGGAAEPIGKKLLRLSDRLFRWWHRLEAERVDPGGFRTAMARLRREVKAALEDGVRCECARTRGTCAEILRVEEGLWTVAQVVGVPTDQQRRGAR